MFIKFANRFSMLYSTRRSIDTDYCRLYGLRRLQGIASKDAVVLVCA